MKSIILLIPILLFALNVSAQKYPFPQNVDYEYGFQSANLTDENVLSEYANWRAKYYKECNSNEARILDFKGTDSISVSEGIGYGMLITAYLGDLDALTKLWNYYKNRRNDRGLMNWRYSDCNTVTGLNGATDADLDVAMALLVATFQWPEQLTFSSDLDTLLENIYMYEFSTLNGITYQKKGDYGNQFCLNPSYFAPAYYRGFAKYCTVKGKDALAEKWNKAADDSYYTLLRNAHRNTGLVYAWTEINGGEPGKTCIVDISGGGTKTSYQYDACRTPWRIATDYLWWGTPEAKMYLSRIVNFVNTPATDQGGWYGAGGIHSIVDGYEHNGKSYGKSSSAPFAGSFSLAGMSSSQYDADNYMSFFSTVSGDNYFNTCMSLLYKLVASGNFWNPYAQENCDYPNLGNDKSYCGLKDKTLTAENVDLKNDALLWYVNGVVVPETGSVISVDSAAFYTVEKAQGNCKTSSTVHISPYIPQPVVMDIESTCMDNAITISLSPQFDNQYNYYWVYENKVIPHESDPIIVTELAGVYRGYVYADECPSRSVRAYIPSSISKVDKPFSIISSGTSLKISATSAKNVEWYSDAEGTLKIGSETSITVIPTASTIYYMKDLESSCGLSPAMVFIDTDCGDMDSDGANDCIDECPLDPLKSLKGKCGCHVDESCVDCDGTAFGSAFIDACDKCSGGTSGRVAVTDTAKCTVDIQPIYEKPFVLISPVPSISDFVFDNNSVRNIQVSIFDCSNKLISSFEVQAKRSISAGADFPKGSYLVTVVADQESQTYRIVKE